jgi:hypothetical protein
MHAPGGVHELGRCAGTVGFVGMGVKVDQAESLPYQFGYRQFPKETKSSSSYFGRDEPLKRPRTLSAASVQTNEGRLAQFRRTSQRS